MADDKPHVLVLGKLKPHMIEALRPQFNLHVMATAKDGEALLAAIAPKLRAIACSSPTGKVPASLIQRLPRLEIVSSFGVGYDHIDVAAAATRGIIVTNTPAVLTEEVADAALGLLLCTIRELPQAERHLRAGRWPTADYPLTPASLRNRSIGIVGLGDIGKAVARRLDGFSVPIAYHNRNPQPGVGYRYYPRLLDMARDVDTLIVITPGGPATRNLIDAEVLDALGPNGILINISRGSVVDEAALIRALQERRILSAGLDVYANEPHVPPALIAMEHVVLLPHVCSGSHHTRMQMDQLVVDNLIAWAAGKPPLAPVPETPWPQTQALREARTRSSVSSKNVIGG